MVLNLNPKVYFFGTSCTSLRFEMQIKCIYCSASALTDNGLVQLLSGFCHWNWMHSHGCHLVISNKIHVNVSVISLDKSKGNLTNLLIVPSIETLKPIHIVMTPNWVKQLLVTVGGLYQSTVAVISLRNTDYSLMTIFTGPPGGTCLQNTTPMIRISCL